MGRFKPLLPLGGKTVIARAVGCFMQAGVSRVMVVTGYRAGELDPAVRELGAATVFNPDFQRDMFSSVRAALKALDPRTAAFFILPVDIPLVRPATIRVLINAFETDKDRIIQPCYNGKRGHPPLIPAAFAPDILAWNGGDGLNGALKDIGAKRIEIDVPDPGILFDLDTEEDYREALRKVKDIESPRSG